MNSQQFDNEPQRTQPEPVAFKMSPPPPARNPRRNRPGVITLFGTLLGAAGLCVCIGICGLTFGTLLFKAITERPNVESVIDEFMGAMADNDAATAYALYSPRAQRQFVVADLEEMLEGNNFALFEGYRSVTVENINVSALSNADLDTPQGIVAEVNGSVTYDGGFTGRFEATLEQDGDEWELYYIYITVSPDKFESDS